MSKLLSTKYFRITLGILLSAITLYLAIRGVTLREVSRSVSEAKTGWVLLAITSVLANTFIKCIRWYRLTGDVGQQVGYPKVVATLLAGQLLNLIYPARAGDVSRILILGRNSNDKAFILGSVLLEKLADLFAYMLLALILSFQLPLPTWLDTSIYFFMFLLLVVIGWAAWLVNNTEKSERIGSWITTLQISWLPERTWVHLIELVQATLSAIGQVRQRQQAAELLFWTISVWLTALLNNILILIALGINMDRGYSIVSIALLVLVSLIAGIAVPSSPGRIGIFEYICVLALTVIGIPQASALTYGILLHAVVFLPGLLLGAVALFWLSWKPSHQTLTPD
jgi:uncharacterized protein (TIRG00374 family)